ncbi:MAG: cytidylate kinase [Alphaproteobacteria bacterium]|nr:MAG: cytidylate kinase [Alphaproteobacteria bacterium]
MTVRPFVIAVDGPSAAGKGTLARRLAAHYGFAFLDTGLLYRAVGRRLLDAGQDPADAAAAAAAAALVTSADLENGSLRGEAVAQAASKVAAIPEVRRVLLILQREFAVRPPALPDGRATAGIVLDGRDIGTVVCPAADVKIFVTASPEERARRRYKELLDRGEDVIYARVLQDMMDRDNRDSGRAASPLVPAADAHVIDSTALDADAAFAAAVALVDEHRRRKVAGGR